MAYPALVRHLPDLLGAATRVSADPLPHIAVSHHIYAALCWVAAAVIWGLIGTALYFSNRRTAPTCEES